MASVRLKDVSFSYPVFDIGSRSLKVSVARQVSGAGIDSSDDGMVTINALRNISFDLKEGDRLGLIGRNGSGKSTLLRVLGGLAHPQSGEMRISGRVVPMIDRGVGIHPELTGFANIELPLRLLGATSKEVREAKQTIPEFTGLGKFMNMPVRTYSEGMRARLAFAICTAIHADVLILDEWLGAGDVDFIEKAETKLKEMLGMTKIVVVATHSLEMIRNTCTHAAWLHGGELLMFGAPDSVISSYLKCAVLDLPKRQAG
jgi:ABC-type polysaccharide/polyol phosphate transport system ATPase subunit